MYENWDFWSKCFFVKIGSKKLQVITNKKATKWIGYIGVLNRLNNVSILSTTCKNEHL